MERGYNPPPPCGEVEKTRTPDLFRGRDFSGEGPKYKPFTDCPSPEICVPQISTSPQGRGRSVPCPRASRSLPRQTKIRADAGAERRRRARRRAHFRRAEAQRTAVTLRLPSADRR